MKLLWIATKAPWPPVDGGRLLLWETLSALRAHGCEIALVAPVGGAAVAEQRVVEELSAVCEPHLVPHRRPGFLRAWTLSLLGRRPVTLVRHEAPGVVEAAGRIVAELRPDVVVAEQLQAYPQAREAARGRAPVVVRAQNVESDLWSAAARRSWLARGLLRVEARRLARLEGEMLADAAAVIAVSHEDAARLREIAGETLQPRVVHPPFPAVLPPSEVGLEGSPALVVLGSAGWIPNRDSIRWVLSELWPHVQRELPAAVLHVFGAPRLGAPGVVGHPAPEESAAAFARGSVLLVPLRVASGIRMKVLEAWARGVPVVATTVAARGLAEGAEDALLRADSARELVAALRRLARPGEAERLCAAGRSVLRERHDPSAIAARLEELLREVAQRAMGGGRSGRQR